MMSRFTALALVFAGLFTLAAGITAIDSAYKNAPDTEVNLEDQALDSQIKEEIVKIEKLHSLRKLKSIHMAPQQTKVRLSGNGECLVVDAHAENHEMVRIKSAPIDYKVQNIQICFTGDKVSRIESAFTTISLQKQETADNSFIHKDPGKVGANDIVLTTAMNQRPKPPVRIGDLENTKVNPLRLSFKRDYYLPHLRNTTYILQLTYDWHKREDVKTNEKTVRTYINRAEN
jgi:hypothetical protein